MATETSEQMYQRIMAQMAQQSAAASKWNSPQNMMNMATLGLNAMSGLAQGSAQGQQNAMSADQWAYKQAQDAYMRRLQGRSGLQGAIMDQLDRRDQAGVNVANASPLGWDQQYRQQMAGQRAMSDVAGNWRPSTGGPQSTISGFIPQVSNVVSGYASPDYRSTISNEATERSIGDRRGVIDGLRADNPDKLARENQLMQLLNAQMTEASAPVLAPYGSAAPVGPAAQPKKSGGGFWRTLGKIGAIAAPIVAAPFTGGASLALIGAGAGAANAALNGGGMKGALLGAGMGAATAGFGGAGAAGKQAIGESAKSALQRAIMNPRAMAQIGGGAMSGMDGRAGQIGQAASMAGMFLPGAKGYTGVQPGFEKPTDIMGMLPIDRNVGAAPHLRLPNPGLVDQLSPGNLPQSHFTPAAPRSMPRSGGGPRPQAPPTHVGGYPVGTQVPLNQSPNAPAAPQSSRQFGFRDQFAAGGVTPRMGGDIHLPSPVRAAVMGGPAPMRPVSNHIGQMRPAPSHRDNPGVSTTMEINMTAPDGTKVPVPMPYVQQLLGEGWSLDRPAPTSPPMQGMPGRVSWPGTGSGWAQ